MIIILLIYYTLSEQNNSRLLNMEITLPIGADDYILKNTAIKSYLLPFKRKKLTD